MPRGGNQPGVKSHRRGRRKRVVRRKLPVAPWIVISTVLVLVGSLLVAGYALLLGLGCSGTPVRAAVAISPSLETTMSKVAHEWQSNEPNIDGQCIGVDLVPKSSAEVASRLGGSWNKNIDGKQPHAWIPESTAWLETAKMTDAGESLIPDKTPYVATSPTVIAMPEPMAKKLGWQSGQKPVAGEPSWQNLVELAGKDWDEFDADWGEFKIGMSNPKNSTSGLHALLSLVDANQDGTVDSDEVSHEAELHHQLDETTESVDDLLSGMADADADGKPLSYLSAFPALERDVWRYNTQMGASEKLTSVYPAEGSLDANFPLAVLQDADWSSPMLEEISKQFGKYLTSDEGQAFFKEAGYRDGTDRSGASTLTDVKGMQTQIAEPQREPVEARAVSTTLTTWQGLSQPINVLFVVDTSQSMGTTETYQGEKKSRLDIVKEELKNTIDLFGSEANVGLWGFSSGGYQSYQELISLGPVDKGYAKSQIDTMQPGGETALNATAVSAYEKILSDYNDEKGADNLVVIISDGGNDDPALDLSTEEMKSEFSDLKAQDRSKSASIMTIGYSEDADAEALRDVAINARGTFHPAKYVDEINVRLLNALFYN